MDKKEKREVLPIEAHIKVLECLPSNIDHMEFGVLQKHLASVLRDTLSILSDREDAVFAAESSQRVASCYQTVNDRLESYRYDILRDVGFLCEQLTDIHADMIEKDKV